jgi:hypothetical protein
MAKKIERREGKVWSVGFFHLWATDANSRRLRAKEGKDARAGFDSNAGFSIELESVRLRQEKPVRSAAEEERRQRRKGSGERGGRPCTRLNTEAAGARSALNCTGQKRIRLCIPARRLKPLPRLSACIIP